MLKEFITRVALVLFILGLTSGAAPDGGNSANSKQQRPDRGSKDTSA